MNRVIFKILSLLLFLFCGITALAADPSHIRLLYARAIEHTYPTGFPTVRVIAAVKKEGAEAAQKAYLVYNTPQGWVQASMYRLDNHDNYAVYEGQIPGGSAEFALKYETDTAEYWDTNSSANHHVSLDSGDSVPSEIVGYHVAAFRPEIELEYDPATDRFDVFLKAWVFSDGADGDDHFPGFWVQVGGLGEDFDEAPPPGATENMKTWYLKKKIDSVYDPESITGYSFAAYLKDPEGLIPYWDKNFDQNYFVAMSPVSSPKVFSQMSTDRVSYLTSQNPVITVKLLNQYYAPFAGDIQLRFYHGAEPVGGWINVGSVSLDPHESAELSYTWEAPDVDGRGYLVVAQALSGGNAVDSITTAIDVSSDWARFPRYGFLSEFPHPSAIDPVGLIDQMKDHHINAVQFYDWHHRPEIPLPSSASTWKDIANRDIFKLTIQNLITEAQAVGMKTFAYNLINGALTNQDSNLGLSAADGLYVRQTTTVEDITDPQNPLPVSFVQDAFYHDFHPLPSAWQADKMYLFNPAAPGWQDVISDAMKYVFESAQELPFDGWHIDTLGNRYREEVSTRVEGAQTYRDTVRWESRDSSNTALDLKGTYDQFITEMKSRAFPTGETGELIFNTVSNYGLDEIISNPHLSVVYSEIWPWETEGNYINLEQYTNHVRANTDKAFVIAGYLNEKYAEQVPDNVPNYFNPASVFLAEAAIMSLGAAHLTLGDGTHYLHSPYFPSHILTLAPGWKEKLLNYSHFLTAYQNLLRDKTYKGDNLIEIQGLDFSPRAEGNKVWVHSKAQTGRDILHFVNLLGNTDTIWQDPYAQKVIPAFQSDLSVKAYYRGALASTNVSVASPDWAGGQVQIVTGTPGQDSQGSYLSFVLPRLEFWTMAWIDKTVETPAAVVVNEDFESTSLPNLPAGWSVLSGTWDRYQEPGHTRELRSQGSGQAVYHTGWENLKYSVQAYLHLGSASSAAAGLLVNVQPDGSFYQLNLSDGQFWTFYRYDQPTGQWQQIGLGDVDPYTADSYHFLRVDVDKNRFTLYIDGQAPIELVDTTQPYYTGSVGLRVENMTARFDNLKVEILE